MANDFFSLTPMRADIPDHVVVDVTLRDGGFRNDFMWSDELASAVVRSAVALDVGYCEVGYVGGVPELHSVTNSEAYSNLSVHRISALAVIADEIKLAVMVHPSSAPEDLDFHALRKAGVSLVRFVYHASWAEKLTRLHDRAKSSDLKTSINVALASRYTPDEIASVAQGLVELEPDIFYLADTCGSLLPSDVTAMFEKIDFSGDLGFHAHDYLSMAAANSLAALASGVKFIDTSVLGLGRGAGNLRSELWYLLQIRSDKRPKNPLLAREALHYIESAMGMPEIPDWISLICGSANLSPPQEDAIRGASCPSHSAIEFLGRMQ